MKFSVMIANDTDLAEMRRRSATRTEEVSGIAQVLPSIGEAEQKLKLFGALPPGFRVVRVWVQ